MTIETKLINDDLTINIVDLLGSLSGEQEQQLIEQLSCSDTIIKHVSDQIINGVTDGGFSGFISCDASTSTALDLAIRSVAKNSAENARKEIESLEKNLLRSNQRADEYVTKYYDLKSGYPS
tara:strand:- start:311 stop:676 length:366 start_codon:yes stop_codon:yes gene_type:complete